MNTATPVPALPGIVTYGRTLEESREMARDAIVCHLRSLIKDGEEMTLFTGLYSGFQPV
jgi:predicted RNase H-like HicB family nuclease